MRCDGYKNKILLLISIAILGIFGIILAGLGLMASCNVGNILEKIFAGDLYVLPITAILFGCMFMFLAVFGFIGAMVESDCVLIIFSVFMSQLILLTICFGAVLTIGCKEIGFGLLYLEAFLRKEDRNLDLSETRAIQIFLETRALQKKNAAWGFGIAYLMSSILQLAVTVIGCRLIRHVRSGLRRATKSNVTTTNPDYS